MVSIDKIKEYIIDIPDYPKKGVIFRDITPLFSNYEIINSIIDEFAEFAKLLNIDVIVRTEESKITLPFRESGNYQMARTSWTGDYNDPMTMLEIMQKGNTFNYGLYDNAAYNTLINNARKTADPAVRMKYMMDAEKLLIDDMPFIPLYHRSYTLMVSPKLKNVVYNALGKHKFNYCYVE